MKLDVQIVRQQRNTVQLTIKQNGGIIVKAPNHLTDNQITEYVNSKKEWIFSKLSYVNKKTDKLNATIGNDHLTLLGEKVNVLVANVASTELVENNLLLPTKQAKNQEDKKRLISAFLTKKAKEILPQFVAQIASKLSVCPTGIKIKDSVAKWGSCDAKGLIMLNSKLIMLPFEIIEYVILHELCHLIELNHSTNFWTIIQNLMPNFKQLRHRLAEFDLLLRN